MFGGHEKRAAEQHWLTNVVEAELACTCTTNAAPLTTCAASIVQSVVVACGTWTLVKCAAPQQYFASMSR